MSLYTSVHSIQGHIDTARPAFCEGCAAMAPFASLLAAAMITFGVESSIDLDPAVTGPSSGYLQHPYHTDAGNTCHNYGVLLTVYDTVIRGIRQVPCALTPIATALSPC